MSIKDELLSVYIKNQNDTEMAKAHFEALYNFYRNFYESSNYSIKILITRRSYVLFKIFERSFIESKFNKRGLFYSSNYLPKINDIKAKKILVVDDIVINGRNMRKMCDKIGICLKKFEPNSNIANRNYEELIDVVYLLTFLENRDAKCIDKIRPLFIKMKNSEGDELNNKVSESFWRAFSNEITSFIVRINMGYTSYVDTYTFLPTLETSEKMRLLTEKCFKQNNVMFSNNNVKGFILYLSDSRKYKYSYFLNYLKKMSIIPCIRMYNVDNNWTIIPFAYLPSISIASFKNYFLKIMNQLKKLSRDNDFIRIINLITCCFQQKEFSENEYIFYYEWLTFALSKFLLSVFISQYPCFETVIKNGLLCKESFNEYYFSRVSINEGSDFFENTNHAKLSENELLDTCEKECVDVFLNLWRADQSFIDSLLLYLNEIRLIDQRRAKNQNDRLLGIRLEDIYSICKITNKKTIVSGIISCWDSGDASGSPKVFGTNKRIIGTSIINGEQIYKYVFCLDEQVTYDFKLFYNNAYFVGKSFWRYMRGFSDYMDKNLHTNKYCRFCSFFSIENISDFENAINSKNIVDLSKVSNKNIDLIMNYLQYYL